MVKGILFNGEMVRAILEGRKSYTRRLIKRKYSNTHLEVFTNKYGTRLIELQNNVEGETFGTYEDGKHWQKLLAMREIEYEHKPCRVGDILYVRETWQECCRNYIHNPIVHSKYCYKASIDSAFYGCIEECGNICKWRPSIHMPKEAARIWLKVTEVRVERIDDMSIQDMINEGINTDGIITTDGPIEYRVINRFEELWNSTVNEDWQKFENNPYVWVISFERCEKPEEGGSHE